MSTKKGWDAALDPGVPEYSLQGTRSRDSVVCPTWALLARSRLGRFRAYSVGSRKGSTGLGGFEGLRGFRCPPLKGLVDGVGVGLEWRGRAGVGWVAGRGAAVEGGLSGRGWELPCTGGGQAVDEGVQQVWASLDALMSETGVRLDHRPQPGIAAPRAVVNPAHSFPTKVN